MYNFILYIYIYVCMYYPIYPMIIVFLSAMDPNCAPQQPPEPNGSGGWLQESLQLVVSLALNEALGARCEAQQKWVKAHGIFLGIHGILMGL